MSSKILLTGDYWHSEFKQLLDGDESLTMVPINQIDFCKQCFDLVVIAQSMPGQFTLEQIEKVQITHPLAPMVALLGSWCEGETRTGVPWPGVQRVYWHQWEGRLESFLQQLQRQGITIWHLPRTATVADKIIRTDHPHPVLKSKRRCVGVSATDAVQYDMLKDAIESLGFRCGWIETASATDDQTTEFNPICIDTGGIGAEFSVRFKWLKERYPKSTCVVLASFPRVDEVQRLVQQGVRQVISKPFTLSDLEYALSQTTDSVRH